MKLVDLPEKNLPPDFAERLVAHIRRRKRVRRLQTVGLFAAIALVAVLAANFRGNPAQCAASGAEIAAAPETPGGGTQASNLLMLGFFRECFRRFKSGKKKEESEQSTPQEVLP